MILLNGTAWYVTKNLAIALSYIRYPDRDRVVWIDALAINQANIPERNAQVIQIPTIYSRASSTLVWLGPIQGISDDMNDRIGRLFSLAQDYFARQGGTTEIKQFCKYFEDMDLDVRINIGFALQEVLLLPYFRRIWVVQEIMYSNGAILIYLTSWIPYSKFAGFLSTMIEFVDCNFQNNWETLAARMDFRSLRQLKSLPAYKGAAEILLPACGSAHRGQYLTLTDWIEHGYSKSSTDPKDRIFGYHGCFPPETRKLITVDYSRKLQEVLTQITPLLFKEAKTLDVMFKCRDAVGCSLEAPSWVLVPRSFGNRAAIQVFQSTIEIPLSHKGKWRAAGSLQLNFNLLDLGKTLHTKGKTAFIVKLVAPPMIPVQVAGETKMEELIAKSHRRETSMILNNFRKLWQIFQPRDSARILAFIHAFHLDTPTETTVLCLLLWIIDAMPAGELHIPPVVQYTIEHSGRSMFSCFDVKIQSTTNDEHVMYGLGPSDLARGDKVCVLQGCSVPVILRPVDDHHILIGEAKVPGIMNGEAVKGIEEGEEEPEDFFIK
jgi:hypothetical protein